ncbi:DDB1- and CUL4-associated factor 10 [Aplysia californica]|uniref:DDB1- and CUL4-associated factor 10 n=1 Tax=Aplysia californica TaxID=6500 RepID=A0ABM0JL59_APLCA|nr:DDB1- and CUL4-associated factor 10 [Aplysia californica]
MVDSPERLAFDPLKYLRSREHGIQAKLGWRNTLYSSIYTHFSDSLKTPVPPCDGQDWGSVFGFGFSSDGSLLAAACERKCVLLYDPVNMRLISRKFNVHNDCVNCVKFLDNRLFATCSDDTTVRLWDMRSLKQEVRILKGHSSWVKNIEYDPSTGILVTSGFDGNVYSWNLDNYSESDCRRKRLLYINGIMRTVLTPSADKMIISTKDGYFVIIHNLDLEHLKSDMEGFRPHPDMSNYGRKFFRDRNKVEVMGDFPQNDDAESISTMEVHPQGWCVASRNTTFSGTAEWTCVHDIQLKRKRRGKDARPSNGCDSDKGATSDLNSETGRRRDDSGSCMFSPPTNSTTQYQTTGRSQNGQLSFALSQIRRQFFDHSDSPLRQNLDSSLSAQVPSFGMFLFQSEPGAYESGDSSSDDSSDNGNDDDDDESNGRNGVVSDDSLPSSPLRENEEELEEEESAEASESLPITSSSNSSATATNSVSHTPSRGPPSSNECVPPQRSAFSAVQDILERNNASVSYLQNIVGYDSFSSFREGDWHRNRNENSLPEMALRLGDNLSTDTWRIRVGRQRRLLFHLEEPNVGSGFIKEQSFSPDGRVLASPFGNCVRLLAFNNSCLELCDCVPSTATALQEVAMVGQMKSIVLASTFSPSQPLFAAGCKDGTIVFSTPKL